jgi:curved DNA-binding protein CbpA
VLYTHYDYLELPPGASTARIEAAYQLIRERLNGHSDEQLVRKIHEAYSVLSSPVQRRAYDEVLKQAADSADRELNESLDELAGVRPRRHVQDVPAPLLVAMNAWAA